ncbi:thaumatin-like protein [Citrus associated ampelovirus 1]|nr:thaumatin-like protein [Citrus associated ampelovirus 1]
MFKGLVTVLFLYIFARGDCKITLHNSLAVDMVCSGGIIARRGSSVFLSGNGRCADVVNDGNRTLFEYNELPIKTYVDLSYVDACTFAAEIVINGVVIAKSDCQCTYDRPILSPCTIHRTNNFCCLENFGTDTTCDIDTEYYKFINSCSTRVYKYAYDDKLGLVIANTTDDIVANIGGAESPANNHEHEPVHLGHSNANVCLRLCFNIYLLLLFCHIAYS